MCKKRTKIQNYFRIQYNSPSAASAASTILLSPEVELTRVTPTVAIILSESQKVPLPDSTVNPQINQDKTTRKRKQKPDDLVPEGCGLSREDIVLLPIDDFNDKVAEKSEREILVLKDKRRRGKNRVSF